MTKGNLQERHEVVVQAMLSWADRWSLQVVTLCDPSTSASSEWTNAYQLEQRCATGTSLLTESEEGFIVAKILISVTVMLTWSREAPLALAQCLRDL